MTNPLLVSRISSRGELLGKIQRRSALDQRNPPLRSLAISSDSSLVNGVGCNECGSRPFSISIKSASISRAIARRYSSRSQPRPMQDRTVLRRDAASSCSASSSRARRSRSSAFNEIIPRLSPITPPAEPPLPPPSSPAQEPEPQPQEHRAAASSSDTSRPCPLRRPSSSACSPSRPPQPASCC